MAIKLSGSTIINDSREVIDANFVGIGTTSGIEGTPIKTRSSTNIQAFFESTDSISGITLGDNTGTVSLRSRDTGDFTISVGGNVGSHNADSGPEALRILGNTQNVGIDTTNPTVRLEVHSTDATILKLKRNDVISKNTGIEFESPDGSIFIGAKTSADFSVASSNDLSTDSLFKVSLTGETTIDCSGTSDALKINNFGSGNSLTINDESGDATPFIISNNGRVAIGTDTVLQSTHFLNQADLDNAGISIGYRYYGFTGTSASSAADGFRSEIGAGEASSTPQVRSFLAVGRGPRTGGTIGKLYSFFAASTNNRGNENYGFYSDLDVQANTFNFYANGSADNYFASNIGIGTTTPLEDIHIFKSQNEGTVLRVENRDPGASANASTRIYADSSGLTLFAHGTGRGASNWGTVIGGYSEISSPTGNGLLIGTKNSAEVMIGTNDERRVTITSGGLVGIGSDTPDQKLSIVNTVNGEGIILKGAAFSRITFDSNRTGNGQAIGQIAWDNNGTQMAQLRGITGASSIDDGDVQLLIRNDGSSYSVLRVSSSGQFHLHDDDDTYIDRPAADEIAFVAGGSQSLFLRNSAGVVATGIGTSVPTFPIEILANNPTLIKGVRPGVNAGISLESNGGSISFGADAAGDFTVNTGANLGAGPILRSDRSTGDLTITGNLVVSSSNGIDFSATGDGSGTASSELLDDYEEGTWTPSYGGTTSDGSCSYDLRNGYYTKIGNVVYFTGRLRTDSIDTYPVGNLTITGLPYNMGTYTNNTAGGGYVVYFAAWSGAGNLRYMNIRCLSGESRIRVGKTTDATTATLSQVNASELTNAANSNDFSFSGFYFI